MPIDEMRIQRLERPISQFVRLDIGIEERGLLDKFFGCKLEFLRRRVLQGQIYLSRSTLLERVALRRSIEHRTICSYPLEPNNFGWISLVLGVSITRPTIFS
jgi:hypothetical protein